MTAVAAFAWSVVQDALHRKVFYGILVFTLILIMLLPLLPNAEVGVQVDLLREGALGLTSIMAFVLAVVLAAMLIPGELGRRTLYNTLSKPVRRWQYYVGKFAGIMLVLAASLALVYIVLVLFVLGKFGLFNPGMLKAIFTIFLEAAILTSVAMLASVHLNPFISSLLAFLFYVLCHLKGDFLYKAMVDSAHNALVRGLSGVGYYILPNLERFNINETVAHGERVFSVGASELFLLVGIATVFAALFICLGSYLFSRRDL